MRPANREFSPTRAITRAGIARVTQHINDRLLISYVFNPNNRAERSDGMCVCVCMRILGASDAYEYRAAMMYLRAQVVDRSGRE